MSLQVGEEELRRIYAHGEDAYPEECCGVLIGHPGSGRIVEVLAADNEREDENRHNRYLISPQALLRAQKSARAKGLEIVGYYHSHPDHPARPSDFDREHAWPGTSYLIISVQKGRVADCRSWRLQDDRSVFSEEEVCGSDGEPVAAAGG
jgi:proteasome lid subunit RPN8/RPN11